IEPWAQEILTTVQSYTEFSPSRKGFRIFAYGQLPPKGRKKGRFEIYETGHYLTVTGDHLQGFPLTIENRPAEILAIHTKVWPPKKGVAQARTFSPLDDRELLALA